MSKKQKKAIAYEVERHDLAVEGGLVSVDLLVEPHEERWAVITVTPDVGESTCIDVSEGDAHALACILTEGKLVALLAFIDSRKEWEGGDVVDEVLRPLLEKREAFR